MALMSKTTRADPVVFRWAGLEPVNQKGAAVKLVLIPFIFHNGAVVCIPEQPFVTGNPHDGPVLRGIKSKWDRDAHILNPRIRIVFLEATSERIRSVYPKVG
jgi:hypothetical protein